MHFLLCQLHRFTPVTKLASKANVDTTCQMPLASCSDFQPFTNLASRASVYTLSQIPLAKQFPFSPFTIFASRASGYPLLQKPHFQIMPIYNSFIIFLIGFLPLVGEFLPQTPNKNRREDFKSSPFILDFLTSFRKVRRAYRRCRQCWF